MNDPTKENLPDLDIQLRSVTWSNKSGILGATFTESRFDFLINEDDSMFEDLYPEGEYKYHDADGLTVAWIDDFFNMHWLIKVPSAFVDNSDGDPKFYNIMHKVVYVKPILETIAERRFNDWK